MQKKPLPSRDELSKFLRYERKTGQLIWLPRETEPIFNARFAGKPAGSCGRDGYVRISVAGRMLLAHRIIWKLVYDAEPDCIDHIDGDPSNNRLNNLRSVSHAENMRNQKLNATNASGHIGVYWNKKCNAWRAKIKTNGAVVHCAGSYQSKEDAARVRQEYAAQLGFHQNHGRKVAE